MGNVRPADPVDRKSHRASRRQFLAVGGAGTLGAALAAPAVLGNATAPAETPKPAHDMSGFGVVGAVAPDPYFDPDVYLTTWNHGTLPSGMPGPFYRETRRGDGTRLREYNMVAWDREIEVAPGMYFPAWTYNGQVPGPTLRATEGDTVRIRFLNQGSHPHTLHFHGWHPDEMDGAFPDQFVEPGGAFTYEFTAEPVGLHLYHCHSVPLKRHIHKGLYGAFIVDPNPARYDGALHEVARSRNPDCPEHRPVRELIMMMNAFDLNFDSDNEVYAVNTVGFHYMRHMIPVRVGQLVRVYLVNITEFDPINSFHLHAGFFDVFRTGTKLETVEHTDTLMLCQAERAIIEFRLRYPGRYMFHAHQSEFAELGWMGAFEAFETEQEIAAVERRPAYAAPDFAGVDRAGRSVRISDYRGKSNVVLVFSLGEECTRCTDQMTGLAAHGDALRAQQAEVVLVVPDVREADFPAIRCVADPAADAARLYGMSRRGRRRHGTFLIDRNGMVRWQDVDDRPFTGYDHLVAELRKLNA